MTTQRHIVIAGASGFIGKNLVRHLKEAGERITQLSRTPTGHRPTGHDHNNAQATWDPQHGALNPQIIARADTVIVLNGAPLTRWPWTRQYKQQLVNSRLKPVRTMTHAINSLPEPDRPHTLLTASAVGFYGDRGEQTLTEQDSGANDFLAGLCAAWEQEAKHAKTPRVIHARTGIVLGGSGLIRALTPLAKLGLLGPVGSGKQWLSPIAISDHARALDFISRTDTPIPTNRVSAINLVGPQPVRNEELMCALAKHFHRPCAPAIPAPLVRIGLGDMAQVVLTSQRVLPASLQDAGFHFHYPTLKQQLKAATSPP